MAERRNAADNRKYPGQLVYGLDIGTRSIVGTVGYMYDKTFHVVAIESKPHETRAMLDGQIHSIADVAESITEVTSKLQRKIGRPLGEVCIAAAGRVLRTVTVHVEQQLEEEVDINSEHVYSLELLGAQRAYEKFVAESTLNIKFYCVGYTVQRYYLNKYPMSDLIDHKGNEIGADVIATFLPDEVVDGLYKAVDMSGLHVADMTLEPIAAMEVAIPQNFRMLNLALVDVGAGTSDISITRDESIVAYGMIPSAGDEITEVIAKHYLTDFDQSEYIKFASSDDGDAKEIKFTDIMGLEQTTTAEEVGEIIAPTIKTITREISDQIKKLNGGKPVSAIFVVGGGGKARGFTDSLADEMGIDRTRVAVRGKDVLKSVDFKDNSLPEDSLLVTPIGICLNFFHQKNNFIFVSFNGVQYKLYDNAKLKIMDAAIQAGVPNADLFPKRGEEVAYTINGNKRVVRGEMGEGAVIKLNGDGASLNSLIKAGDIIELEPSTAGEGAHIAINKLPEFKDSLKVILNGNEVVIPKYAEVNGSLQSGYYEIQNGDEVIMRDYVTLKQLLEFLDVRPAKDTEVMINHIVGGMDSKVYENFAVDLLIDDSPAEEYEHEETEEEEAAGENAEDNAKADKAPDTKKTAADTGEAGSDAGGAATEDTADNTGTAKDADAVKGDKAAGDTDAAKAVEAAKSADTAKAAEAAKPGTDTVTKKSEVSAGDTPAATEAGPTDAGKGATTPAGGDKKPDNSVQDKAAESFTTGSQTVKPQTEKSAADNKAQTVQSGAGVKMSDSKDSNTGDTKAEKPADPTAISVTVNDKAVTLTGKKDYVFVDVFDKIDFDLTKPHGKMVITKLNGMKAEYSAFIHNGDRLDVYWET